MANFKNIFKVVGSEQAAAPSTGSEAGGDITERIRKDIESNPILVFMKGTPEMPQCGFSAAVAEVFQQMGVSYASRNVLEDPELRQGIKDYSNWPTIPQIYVGGKFVGGCDIVLEMATNGQLEPIVKEALAS